MSTYTVVRMDESKRDRSGDVAPRLPASGPAAAVPDTQRGLAELLGRIADGDRAAFGSFYDATSARVYGLITRVLRDRALSEDATQEVYLQVWRGASAYDPAAGTPLAWLMTLAHRRAVDRVRAEQRLVQRENRYSSGNRPVEHDEVFESVAGRLEAADVADCLDTLTGTQRESVDMAYYAGLTYRVVAEKLGAALPTVKSRIRDGLIRLKDCLEVR
jgi:RNA polymerase sigma-70 factor (ECF subfamily)